ncbi:unnamed protein product [Discosporangium mesarthrocarpum]
MEADQRRSRARRAVIGQSIKRGMIRYLYLALDMSKAMSEGDMRPSRLAVTLRVVQDFITNYFDQNPLSQLGIIVTRQVDTLDHFDPLTSRMGQFGLNIWLVLFAPLHMGSNMPGEVV